MMEWDKIWAMNKQVIDPIVPRYTAVASTNIVELQLDGPDKPGHKMQPLHPKNPEMGERTMHLASTVYLEQDDAALIEEGEQVTLMSWGNVYIDKIEKKGDMVIRCTGRLNLQGNVKETSKKIHFLAKVPQKTSLVLLEYDHLITQPKIDEDGTDIDKLMNSIINRDSEQETEALGDEALSVLKKGDQLQLMRRGYFIVDHVPANAQDKMRLIRIPDGKSKEMSTVKSKVNPKAIQGIS